MKKSPKTTTSLLSCWNTKERMLKVEIVLTETIKPSSPTPLHLRSFKLSLLDQLAPHEYVSLILFYPNKDNDYVVQVSHKLKRSLSETLTFFYPLAGRVKKDDTIDCNDEGVDLLHARVYGQLSEFLKQPHVEVLDQLLPCDFFSSKSGADVLLAIQVNVFDCGGLAIGVSMSHKIADVTGLLTFLNNWSTVARGATIPMDARLVSDSLFPPRSSVPTFVYDIGKNIVTKRLVFYGAAIATLRAKASDPSKLKSHPPTRVEAVSALIWRCVMRARCDEASATVSVATHVVNLRGRMTPPVPSSYFGNLWVTVVTEGAMANECNGGFLEMQLRDAIRGVNGDFIKELQGPDGAVKAHECMNNVAKKYSDCDIHFCNFTSWYRFPFYELDFGLGKPIWVSSCSVPLKNVIGFIGTRYGDGMEAWVSMEADEMAKFEQDPELLSFVNIP